MGYTMDKLKAKVRRVCKWKTLLNVLTLLVCIGCVSFLLVGLLNLFVSGEENFDEHTYGSLNTKIIPVEPYTGKKWFSMSLKNKYKMVRLENPDRDPSVSGIPVLFIPGNGGTFSQGVDYVLIASQLARELNLIQYLEFFALDLNSDLSAVYGGLLQEQAEFAAKAIESALATFQDQSSTGGLPAPRKVVLLGHSMGGVVAHGAYALHPEIQKKVSILITLASPLQPAVNLDAHIADYYRRTMQGWRQALDSGRLQELAFISLDAGNNDTTVLPEKTRIPFFYQPLTLFVSSTDVPDVWLSSGHLAITWSINFALKVAYSLFGALEKDNMRSPNYMQITDNPYLCIDSFKRQFTDMVDEGDRGIANKPIVDMSAAYRQATLVAMADKLNTDTLQTRRFEDYAYPAFSQANCYIDFKHPNSLNILADGLVVYTSEKYAIYACLEIGASSGQTTCSKAIDVSMYTNRFPYNQNIYSTVDSQTVEPPAKAGAPAPAEADYNFKELAVRVQFRQSISTFDALFKKILPDETVVGVLLLINQPALFSPWTAAGSPPNLTELQRINGEDVLHELENLKRTTNLRPSSFFSAELYFLKKDAGGYESVDFGMENNFNPTLKFEKSQILLATNHEVRQVIDMSPYMNNFLVKKMVVSLIQCPPSSGVEMAQFTIQIAGRKYSLHLPPLDNDKLPGHVGYRNIKDLHIVLNMPYFDQYKPQTAVLYSYGQCEYNIKIQTHLGITLGRILRIDGIAMLAIAFPSLYFSVAYQMYQREKLGATPHLLKANKFKVIWFFPASILFFVANLLFMHDWRSYFGVKTNYASFYLRSTFILFMGTFFEILVEFIGFYIIKGSYKLRKAIKASYLSKFFRRNHDKTTNTAAAAAAVAGFSETSDFALVDQGVQIPSTQRDHNNAPKILGASSSNPNTNNVYQSDAQEKRTLKGLLKRFPMWAVLPPIYLIFVATNILTTFNLLVVYLLVLVLFVYDYPEYYLEENTDDDDDDSGRENGSLQHRPPVRANRYMNILHTLVSLCFYQTILGFGDLFTYLKYFTRMAFPMLGPNLSVPGIFFNLAVSLIFLIIQVHTYLELDRVPTLSCTHVRIDMILLYLCILYQVSVSITQAIEIYYACYTVLFVSLIVTFNTMGLSLCWCSLWTTCKDLWPDKLKF